MKRRAGSREVRTVTASEFKAKCLAILEDVGEGGGDVTVTKQGRVVACLERVPSTRPLRRPNLAHLFEFIGDVESPLDVEWKAMK